jgi:hypothetical protein
MISVKAFVYRKLVALGYTKFIYEGALPKNPRYPATVYVVIDHAPADLTHDEGVVGFRKARLQLEVYAESIDEVEDIAERYWAALRSVHGLVGDGLSPETSLELDFYDDGKNPDMDFEDMVALKGIYGRSHDFIVHF